jgi:LmbE family N-acetylglucosaminyl deacetylase
MRSLVLGCRWMNAIVKSLLRTFVRAARPHVKFTGLLQTSGVFDRSAAVWMPGSERVLVLAPHMDDETIGCGGTLALHARAGAHVAVVFLTDGRNGGGGIGALSGAARQRKQLELTETRKQEAEHALKTIGIADMRCVGICDGELGGAIEAAAEQLRDILREIQPEIVYVPMFVDQHSDHRAANDVLLSAAAELPFSFTCAGYEVWTPLFPNCIVRIDSTVALKEAALKHYASQLQDGDYLRAAMGLTAYRSIALHGARGSHAEAFFMCPLATYRALYAEFLGSPKTATATVPPAAPAASATGRA